MNDNYRRPTPRLSLEVKVNRAEFYKTAAYCIAFIVFAFNVGYFL